MNFDAKNLSERRKALNLKQIDLAKKIKVAPPYISEIEAGKKQPSARVAEAIERVLAEEAALRSGKIHQTKTGQIPIPAEKLISALDMLDHFYRENQDLKARLVEEDKRDREALKDPKKQTAQKDVDLSGAIPASPFYTLLAEVDEYLQKVPEFREIAGPDFLEQFYALMRRLEALDIDPKQGP